VTTRPIDLDLNESIQRALARRVVDDGQSTSRMCACFRPCEYHARVCPNAPATS